MYVTLSSRSCMHVLSQPLGRRMRESSRVARIRYPPSTWNTFVVIIPTIISSSANGALADSQSQNGGKPQTLHPAMPRLSNLPSCVCMGKCFVPACQLRRPNISFGDPQDYLPTLNIPCPEITKASRSGDRIPCALRTDTPEYQIKRRRKHRPGSFDTTDPSFCLENPSYLFVYSHLCRFGFGSRRSRVI